MSRVIEHVKIGHYLATNNWVTQLRHYSYGWKMRDYMGNVYKQNEHPEGFRVWYKKPTFLDMQGERLMSPWPPTPDYTLTKQRDQSGPAKYRARDALHLKRVSEWIWCDVHGCVHERKSDPYQDETYCKALEWRPLFVHARKSEGEF